MYIQVGVHIADVSHFIRPGTAIDREAANRGTTVYLTDQRIDMVPADATLVSIHLDSSHDERTSGLNAYCASYQGCMFAESLLFQANIANIDTHTSLPIRKDFAVLFQHNCSSLLEVGFISNPQDRRQALSEKFVAALANMILRAMGGSPS